MVREAAKAYDHDSDPAHVPGDGWGAEGGASHIGPATHTGDPTTPRVTHWPEGEEPADDSEE